jgi:hypothetical protein
MNVRRAVARMECRVVKAERNDEVSHAGSKPEKGLPREALFDKALGLNRLLL